MNVEFVDANVRFSVGFADITGQYPTGTNPKGKNLKKEKLSNWKKVC